MRETFIKRYIVERTNKADIRLEEQSEKAESLWNEIQLKEPQDRNRHKNRNKEWASSVGLCHIHKWQHPRHVKVSPRGLGLW